MKYQSLLLLYNVAVDVHSEDGVYQGSVIEQRQCATLDEAQRILDAMKRQEKRNQQHQEEND